MPIVWSMICDQCSVNVKIIIIWPHNWTAFSQLTAVESISLCWGGAGHRSTPGQVPAVVTLSQHPAPCTPPGSAGSTQQLKTLPLVEESRWSGSGGWVLLDDEHSVPPVRLLHLLVVHHHRGRGAPRRRPRPRQDLPGLPRARPHPLLLRPQPGLPAARLQGGHRLQGE